METGRALDISMSKSTVLGVQAADGTTAFTRRGDLRVSGAGLLENMAGQVVLGEGGTITMPQGKLFSVTADGTILASSPTNPKRGARRGRKAIVARCQRDHAGAPSGRPV